MYKLPEELAEYKCYHESFLERDMENMGFLFEYCDKYCRELFDIIGYMDVESFLTDFMHSRTRALAEIGWPKLFYPAAINTLEFFVTEDLDWDTFYDYVVPNECCYAAMQLYWIGWMYAYIHCMTKVPSSVIVDVLPISQMLIRYKCGHEMSKEAFFDRVKDLFVSGG